VQKINEKIAAMGWNWVTVAFDACVYGFLLAVSRMMGLELSLRLELHVVFFKIIFLKYILK
jgi:hypothetical protein